MTVDWGPVEACAHCGGEIDGSHDTRNLGCGCWAHKHCEGEPCGRHGVFEPCSAGTLDAYYSCSLAKSHDGNHDTGWMRGQGDHWVRVLWTPGTDWVEIREAWGAHPEPPRELQVICF